MEADHVDLTQPDMIDLTQPDMIDLTKPDKVDLTQSDDLLVPGVIKPASGQRSTARSLGMHIGS